MAQKVTAERGWRGEATRAGGREDRKGGREAIAISDSMSSDGGGGCGSRMKEERRCCGIERGRERRYTFCKRDGRADLGLQLLLDKRPLSLQASLRHALKSGGRQSGVDRKYPILTDSGGRGGQMEPIYLFAFLCDVSFFRGGRRTAR